MIVLKFGGSSVSTPERIQSVIKILLEYKKSDKQICVVFSAFGGVTNELIKIANTALNNLPFEEDFQKLLNRHLDAVDFFKPKNQNDIKKHLSNTFEILHDILKGIKLIKELSPKTLDHIMSFGERSSSYIIAEVLNTYTPSVYLNTSTCIFTNDNFNNAKVDFKSTNTALKKYFDENKNKIICATGFIGSFENAITTLGRGGSDYTASIIGVAIQAKSVEIWTDVNGVLTADPRKVKNTFSLKTMTYAEAMEMSHFGAKVIYPPTLVPIYQKNIPLIIKNTFNPKHPGTYISNKSKDSRSEIKGISSISNISLLTLSGSGMFGVPGSAGRLFNALAKAKINIILITQGSSEQSISFAIDPMLIDKAVNAVHEEFQFELKINSLNPITVETRLSVIAIIGENMKFKPGIAGKMFSALGKNGINIHAISQGSSEFNVSVVISEFEETKALNTLHDAFFLSDYKTINVFIVGYGLIGKTLLKQIKNQAAYLLKQHFLKINIVGITNTRKMIFDPNGIHLDEIETTFEKTTLLSNLEIFVQKMIDFNLSNSIFVDNTADAFPPQFYERILNESISIVTPNKIAASSPYKNYRKLKDLAKLRNINFLYETNVGAGLPIISTIHDLVLSGDKILKIEAVLSGSLSFVFNNFNSKIKFHDIVMKAKELGYTEPDPREDLTGKDVSRKVLILAREIGIKQEIEDIKIESFLPNSSLVAPDVNAFFADLKNQEDYFCNLILQAEKNKKVLRFVAIIEKNKSTIALRSFDATHPFYMLSGSDNMLVFTTERYKERPLVIRGPGAGAEVTAAGVFADIIKIANYISK
jgi:bifunctional aspartokinase / homoserine dehydrogenase 1